MEGAEEEEAGRAVEYVGADCMIGKDWKGPLSRREGPSPLGEYTQRERGGAQKIARARAAPRVEQRRAEKRQGAGAGEKSINHCKDTVGSNVAKCQQRSEMGTPRQGAPPRICTRHL